MHKLYLLLLCISNVHATNINTYFESIKQDPKALYNFLYNMPKGGELHYHFHGSNYAHDVLHFAAEKNMCVEKSTNNILLTKPPCSNALSARSIQTNTPNYNQVIKAWSMQNFHSNHESKHDHFFATFQKFDSVYKIAKAELLATILQRAAKQHEQYLEIIAFDANNEITHKLEPTIKHIKNFNQRIKILRSHPIFKQGVHDMISNATSLLANTRSLENCMSNPKQEFCQIKVGLQAFVKRAEPKDRVFIEALISFTAASQSNNIVAVNLVQAEDNAIAIRDYKEHMKIFQLMHKIYPKVAISLHAGELSPGIVAPKDLKFHIHDAVLIGNAMRIGHGVDIKHEKDKKSLLNYIRQHNIAVEINLTSNATILNIFGKQHPLNFYLQNHIPVILSTDDEGILVTNLTKQYMIAVLEHHLDYNTIKTINRNSLTYSFIPGPSIWLNAEKGILVKPCRVLTGASCIKWIHQSTKAQQQWQLEMKLRRYEEKIAK